MKDDDRFSKMDQMEQSIANLEQDIRTIAQVVSATADDTLRACLVLQEIADAGYLPELPWELASTIVSLRHAQLAAKEANIYPDGSSIAHRIAELEARISDLRETFRKRAHEQAE